VVDHEGLPEARTEPLAHRPRNDIDPAAGWKRRDHPYGLGRILRIGRRIRTGASHWCQQRAADRGGEFAHGGFLSWKIRLFILSRGCLNDTFAPPFTSPYPLCTVDLYIIS